MKTNRIISLLLGLLAVSSFEAFSQDAFADPDTLAVPGSLLRVNETRKTGAVATASGEDIYKSATPNLTNALSGKLPGLFVINGGGTPGSDLAKLYIRGIGSYAQDTDVNTLKFFVDGFEVKSDYIQYLTPDEIETISVFKDAASLAQFGMNGANGVLWIETKRGTVGAPVISFQARSGIQQAINIAKPVGSYDYANLYNQAYSNDHGMEWNPQYDQETLNSYLDGTGVNVNWYDEVFKQNGMYSDGSLSMRGGSALAKYNVVLDYANQQGLLNVENSDKTKNAAFVKYGVRTNIDMKLNDILTVSVDVGGRLEDRFRPNYGIASLISDVMSYPANLYPINDEAATDPIFNFSGTVTHPNNPVASLKGIGWTTSRTKVLQANFKFKEDLSTLLKGLYLQEGFSFYSKTTGNTGKTSTYARYYNGVAQTSDISTYLASNGYSSSGKERWMQGNVTLGYGSKFDDNAIDAALSAHISDFNGTGSAFYNWKYRYINYSGRVNYSFDDRYIADLSFSYFGSDAYARGNNYVLYPAASLAWVVSNESFLEDSNLIKYLKLRASAGFAGATEANVGISGFGTNGRYLYRQYYSTTGAFATGLGPGFSNGSSAFGPLFTANPDVTAEKSLKLDAGFEVNLGGKFSLTADYFLDKRTGILTLDKSVMDYHASKDYYSNIGEMTNQGAEGSFVFADKAGDFKYSVFGSAVYAVNTINYMGEVKPKYKYNELTGLPYGTVMGLKNIGFYTQADFDLDGNLLETLPQPLFGSVQPGDLRYEDMDGDGYVDETDIIKIGEPAYPKLTFNLGGQFEFKGLDFSFMFTGSAGASVNMLDYDAWKPLNNLGTAFEWAKGAWAYYPEAGIDTRETATFPRMTTEQNENNYRASSFWIRKNDFIRLQNVELGYNFSNLSALRKAGISKCRLYVNALNMLTFSSLLNEYKMDPETADYGYPALKSVNMGVQIIF